MEGYFSRILLLLLVIIIQFSTESIAEEIDCQDGSFNCLCGTPPNEKTETFLIQRQIMPSLHGQSATCSSKIEMREFCASISCIFVPSSSTDKENSHIGMDRETILLSKGRKAPFINKLPKSCNDTFKPVEDAHMYCALSQDRRSMTCNINCAYGFAIRENNEIIKDTTRTCKKGSPTWTLPVCEPYINCKAVLFKSGDLYCIRSVKYPTYCYITCDFDGEHDAVPRKGYKCVDESFTESLPHCAAADHNVDLIPHAS